MEKKNILLTIAHKLEIPNDNLNKIILIIIVMYNEISKTLLREKEKA